MKMISLEGKREVKPPKEMRSSKRAEMHNGECWWLGPKTESNLTYMLSWTSSELLSAD